jgi:hypothetical protein
MFSQLLTSRTLVCALGLIFIAALSGCSGQQDTKPVQVAPETVNNPPVIVDLHVDTREVQPLGKSNVTCTARDANGDNLTYRWTTSGGVVDSTGAAVTWTAPSNPGSYLITVVVSDGKGGAASQDITITVQEKPNNPPIITAIKFTRPGRMPITVKANASAEEMKKTPELVIRKYETGAVECVAQDQDKDQLTYIWRASGGKIIGSGPNIEWLAAGDPGTYTINCEVSDGKGGTSSLTITISVHCCSG